MVLLGLQWGGRAAGQWYVAEKVNREREEEWRGTATGTRLEGVTVIWTGCGVKKQREGRETEFVNTERSKKRRTEGGRRGNQWWRRMAFETKGWGSGDW